MYRFTFDEYFKIICRLTKKTLSIQWIENVENFLSDDVAHIMILWAEKKSLMLIGANKISLVIFNGIALVSKW